jgi:hypothetical protein
MAMVASTELESRCPPVAALTPNRCLQSDAPLRCKSDLLPSALVLQSACPEHAGRAGRERQRALRPGAFKSAQGPQLVVPAERARAAGPAMPQRRRSLGSAAGPGQPAT